MLKSLKIAVFNLRMKTVCFSLLIKMQSQTTLFNRRVEPAWRRKTSVFDAYIKVHLVKVVLSPA